MRLLEWDQVGEHLYETGVDQVVLYPYNTVSKEYTPGVAWNGMSALTQSPSGAESNPVYADNMKYLDLYSAEEFGGTIEAYMAPEEWLECDGSKLAAKGVSVGQQNRKTFGLCYRTIIGNDTEGNDYGYKLHLIWGAKASPSERSNTTVNESPEAMSLSWEFKSTPVKVEGYKPISLIEIDSTKVDPEKLAALEAILYGTKGESESADVVAKLPSPAEVLAMFPAG